MVFWGVIVASVPFVTSVFGHYYAEWCLVHFFFYSFNIACLLVFRRFLGGGILFLYVGLRLCCLGLVFVLGRFRRVISVGNGRFFGIWNSSW